MTPDIILNEVTKLYRQGIDLNIAMKTIAKKHDLRFADVKIVCVMFFQELWKSWDPRPRRRRRRKKR